MEPNKQTSGTPYHKARTIDIALSQTTGIMQMAFYVLLGYAAYIGNLGYAITTALVGILITLSRVFDGITDPIIAWIIEKCNWKHGKARLFLVIGWVLMAVSTTLMCNVFAGKFSWADEAQTLSSGAGIAVFILIYMLYIIGYTFTSCTANMIGNILTNDPKQRPTLSVWATIYSYLSPMIISAVIMTVLLPKFGIQQANNDFAYTNEVFAWANYIVVGVSFVALILCCIGLRRYDKPENYVGLHGKTKVTMKDMWSLLKSNKELRRYIVAASSDKLAQGMASQSVITTLLFSVILGSAVGSTIVSLVAMVPSIAFVIIGARLAGKQGNKKVMVFWSWICIAWNILFTLFILFVPQNSGNHFGFMLILFFILMLGNNAVKMVVSVATGAMRMDVVDYELQRSGSYLPATVSAVYSFIDKLVSAVAPMLATLLIGLVGYTGSRIPMAGDELTFPIRIITAVIYCGFPIVGWVCTLLAMRKFSLTKEKMEAIQKEIAVIKAQELAKANGEIAETSPKETIKEAGEEITNAVEPPSEEK